MGRQPVTRLVDRRDDGLAKADSPLARAEERLTVVRADLDGARGEAERLADENPELPRVKVAVDKLLGRVVPTIDRAAALGGSLRTVAKGLRAAEDVATQLGGGAGWRSRVSGSTRSSRPRRSG